MIKKFSLPDYYGKRNYLIELIQYKKDSSLYFYPDRIIDSCYGAHPDILWIGGRKPRLTGHSIPMELILEYFSKYPQIELRHVCSNLFITEELTKDYKTNYFLSHYLRPNDKIIAANPILIDYLKKEYPNTDIIYSTTMNITDPKEINVITENNIYVLNYNYLNDNNYLNKLTHRNNIEILCGEPCPQNCSFRQEHYEIISKAALGQAKYEEFICPYDSQYYLCDEIINLPNAVTNARVDELSQMGIQYFKISGRTLKLPNWLALILYYLVKPEYYQHVFLELLDYWWNL